MGGTQWTATCGAQTYYCSKRTTVSSVQAFGNNGSQSGMATGSSVSCSPGGDGAASAAPRYAILPPVAPPSNGVEPPKGAAGFAFGADAGALEQVCSGAGLSWKALPEGRFSCSGAPTDVGFPVTTAGRLCGGKLCEISLDAAREGDWAQLAERYAKLLGSLTAKYGGPAKQETEALEDCSDEVQRCFKSGRARTHARWRWPNGHTLDLTLSGGATGARPELWVVYRKPNEAPRSDAL
jgi:hypothetical protein